ncbi:MAG: hypothetical protein R3B13_00370 [Polyangiaceae bacterium]
MHLVDRSTDLPPLVDALRGKQRFFLDTEFESTRAGTTLSLVQIHDGSDVHVVDALRLGKLSVLGEALGQPNCEWILHAGQQDVPLLTAQLGLSRLPRVLDTQIAWACCSPEASVSLAYLEMVLLGKRRAKGHQADDWKRRPLPASQLAYAAEDVANLPALLDAILPRLQRLDRVEIAFEASQELLEPEIEAPRRLRLSDFRNAWQLDAGQQAALHFLLDWHASLSDARAQRAPDAKTLMSIAARLPKNARELSRIKGVPQRLADAEGAALCAGLARAAAGADQEGFEPIFPPPYATFGDIRREGWLAHARAELAASLEIAPELLMPSRVVKSLRAAWEDTGSLQAALDELRGFRRKLLAPALREFAQSNPVPENAAVAASA